MADWEDDNFEPGEIVKKGPSDKWADEDVEDDVKDNWDDEDEDKGSEDSENTQTTATQVKKKKPLNQRIAEREEKKRQEKEEKRRQEEEASRKMTAEEIAAEKLRQLKIQEDADLELAKEAFGVTNSDPAHGVIDSMDPSSREDFDKFAHVLRDKITKYESSAHYVSFLETLYRDLSVSLEPDDLKKLGSTLNTLANEKAKAQRGTKSKKGKQKAKLQVGKSDQPYDDVVGYDEFDDFL